jgi:hypothetical protein
MLQPRPFFARTDLRRLPDRRAALAALACCAMATRARAAQRVAFSDLLNDAGDFTDIAKAASGREVEMRGYMAPPLKPEINFFILTRLPAAVCPFCDAAASWPDDIVMVQMARPIHAIAYDALIRVTGLLDIGDQTDEITGFVSRVRLREARYQRA